jgi:2-aminoadipate transaminase
MQQSRFGFSEVSKRTPESPISYFMQQAVENQDIISLAAGLVDTGSLPVQEISSALNDILGDPIKAREALQYGEKIAKHLASLDKSSTPFSPKDIVVTTGSQQLLYILSEVLIDEGDIVITEAPSYFVYQAVLAGRGAEVVSIPMDEEGMQIHALEERLKQIEAAGNLPRIKIIYTVDYYQNPSGRTLSLARRKELMALMNRWSNRLRAVIVEDAAYRELRFDGPDIPSLKSMDPENKFVVYAGTFSKPCSPGLKSGYALMPTELVRPILIIKANHDFGSSNLTQHTVDRLLENGDYQKHVLELQEVYGKKSRVMLEALESNFAAYPEVTWTKPTGGMFVWLKLPEHISTGLQSEFLKAAMSEGVLYVPGIFAYRGAGPLPDSEMRITYGDASVDRIREGIHRLKKAYLRVKDTKPAPARTASSPKPALV